MTDIKLIDKQTWYAFMKAIDDSLDKEQTK